MPAVVQIHDPGFRLCNQLRRNASSAADKFRDRLLYRVAVITTPEGRRLRQRHEVPQVTLLLFDADGRLRRVLSGVRGKALLEHAFAEHVEHWR